MSLLNEGACSAYGCPLDGSMSLGTGQRKKWWCFYHFGRDFNSYQAITAELHRLQWLAFAIRDIRRYAGDKRWPEVYKRIKHDIALAQRNDLQFFGNAKETKSAWLARLDDELKNLMAPVLKGTVQKSRIYPTCIHADSILSNMKCVTIKRGGDEENGVS